MFRYVTRSVIGKFKETLSVTIMSIHLDPLWDYCLISPDTLSARQLSTLAIHRKEEIPEEVGEGWEVVKVLPRPLSIDEYEWSSIPLEFHMVGQISPEGCLVQTWHPSNRDPRTDILFRLERRPHDPAARIQWKKNIKKLQSALNHVQHLTGSSIGTSTLFTEAAHPWDQKLCCIGMQLHNDPVVPSGKSQVTASPEASEKECQHFSSSVLQQSLHFSLHSKFCQVNFM